MIAIVDYGSGNVAAIANIYKQLKIPHIVTGDLQQLSEAERYILPGVGAFDTVMSELTTRGIVAVLDEQVLVKKKKAMGICVGMQILGSSSDEGQRVGLGWIPGRIRRIKTDHLLAAPKLPHMGWNSVKPCGEVPLLKDVDYDRGFYFLHSFYFDAEREEDVVATAHYGEEVTCGVASKNIFGFQFHPEKSHGNGVTVFRNFAEI